MSFHAGDVISYPTVYGFSLKSSDDALVQCVADFLITHPALGIAYLRTPLEDMMEVSWLFSLDSM